MNNNYICLENGKQYILDINKIIDYCSKTGNEKMSETSVSEFYKPGFDGMELYQKQIDEHKTNSGSLKGSDNLKYDFIKAIVEIVMTMGIKQEEGAKVIKSIDMEDVSISETIAWNTLLNMGFLIEI